MDFKKHDRSYKTPPGWRLATFKEVEGNLGSIQGLLEGRDRARLLDGWIGGPYYNFKMGNNFNHCMSHMLVIQVHTEANNSFGDSGKELYEGVSLTEEGKRTALFLCAYDWNFEVVYWLLNSWDKTQTMDPRDVRDGRIPSNDSVVEETVRLNNLINDLARKYGETFADEQTRNKKLTADLVRNVLRDLGTSVLEKFTEDKEFLNRSFQTCIRFYDRNDSWFKAFESPGNSAWNSIWHHFCTFHLLLCTNRSLSIVINKLLKDESAQVTTSQRNFILSSSILYYTTQLHEKYCRNVIVGDSGGEFFNNFNLLDQILHLAASEGDVIITKKMLDCGAHVLSQDQYKKTALHAVFRRSLEKDKIEEVVTILLERCDAKEDQKQLVNSPDKSEKTALHLASSQRNSKMCRLLLDKGAKPDVKDSRRRLPLHYAVEENYIEAIEVVTILMDRCDAKEQERLVNSPDEKRQTVLHLASSGGAAKMCSLLLDYGAKRVAKDDRDRLPLHYAVEKNKDEAIEVVTILMDRCDAKEQEQLVNSPDEEGQTVLHLASSGGTAKMCRLLLYYGAKPGAKDNRDRLPLHYAVKENNDEAVDVLINVSDQDSIGMLNSTDIEGKSPSDIAVDTNNIKLMAKLFPILEQPSKSYFNKVDTSKLLRQFASQGNEDIVRKLLKWGASPLDVDWEGKTALHHAAMCEDESRAYQTIRLILRKCQDREKLISMCDNKGKTAVHVAAFNGIPLMQFEDSLVIKDRDGRSPIYDATQGKKDDRRIIQSIIRMMKTEGISLDDLIDNSGLTPLHMAASQGKVLQVDTLLSFSRNSKKYVKRGDYLGQTALHKAAKGGHLDTIKVLLHWGAQPLLERDCDGRTALHYAVQTKTGEDGVALAELLLKKCGSKEKKLLFLCASAAGLGTADQNLSHCPLKTFLSDKRKELNKETDNLLRTAARMGDTGMAKELLTRGYEIEDIRHEEWRKGFEPKVKLNVEKVLKEIQMIAEQGNDRPSLSDNLGRADFARGLAALLLNPFLKPPIAIGISGHWGMGKSSLMLQTEIILLKTAAQAALLPTSKPPDSNLPGVKEFELSKVGQKRYNEIKRWIKALTKTKSKESQGKQREDSLDMFLNNYEPEYHKIFKLLAAIDNSDMFIPKDQQSHSGSDSPSEGSVPAIITVRYNAWKYRNESEALAGMAVQITKEMEGIMTQAQWLSTCLRNTCRKQEPTVLIKFIFPCLLAIFLAGAFTQIIWLLSDRYNFKESVMLKYASLPVSIIFMAWPWVESVMSILNPVSIQLMNYIKLPDHTDMLGYQDRVISDITFLKGEIRKRPFFLCSAASYIWHLVTICCCMISYLCPIFFRGTMANSKAASTSTSYASDNPRIIVFVDDLDRCQESVILQVLSAINLVLAVCEISAIVGMDKALIQRAIIKEYGDMQNNKELEDKSLQNNKELADKYLKKIIQLPLDLPDPSEDESKSFLKRQLGVFSKQLKDEDGEPETDVDDDSKSEFDADYHALFSKFDDEKVKDLGDRLKKVFNTPDIPDRNIVKDAWNALRALWNALHSHCMESASSRFGNLCRVNARQALMIVYQYFKCPQSSAESSALRTDTGDLSSRESIPIREMLFVRYSEGEQEAFCYFQKMATDWRKLPRHWKCLLYYHRLVWYIFSMSNEARNLDGWQVQLITWIFICWEWEENINILIQNWHRIGILQTYRSKPGPSLRAIVEHYIENEDKDKKMSDTGDDKHKDKVSEKSEDKQIKAGKPKEDLKEKDVSQSNTEEVKAEKLKEDLKQKDVSQSNTEEMKAEKLKEDLKEKDVSQGNTEEIKAEKLKEDLKEKDVSQSNAEEMKVEKPKEDLKERDVSNNSTEENQEMKGEKSKEDIKGKGISKNTEDPESSNREQLEAFDKRKMGTMSDSQADAFKRSEEGDTLGLLEHSKNKETTSAKMEGGMKEKYISNNVVDGDESSDRVVDKLKEFVNRAISEKLDDVVKTLMELEKEIRDLKETKQQTGENKKSDEEEKTRRNNWQKMKAALKRYDVSMEGIQAFQRFRFYCVSGYLPWPLPKQRN